MVSDPLDDAIAEAFDLLAGWKAEAEAVRDTPAPDQEHTP